MGPSLTISTCIRAPKTPGAATAAPHMRAASSGPPQPRQNSIRARQPPAARWSRAWWDDLEPGTILFNDDGTTCVYKTALDTRRIRAKRLAKRSQMAARLTERGVPGQSSQRRPTQQ